MDRGCINAISRNSEETVRMKIAFDCMARGSVYMTLYLVISLQNGIRVMTKDMSTNLFL